jgi:putative spermidine/putrescine transport system substrate-binding protein
MRSRTWCHVLIIGLMFFALASCERQESAKTEQPGQLQLASFGGSFQEALDRSVVQPIAKKLGIGAKIDTYGGEYDHLAATIKSGTNTYDLVHVETRFLIQGGRQDLLAPIDWKVVDRSAFVTGATDTYGVGLLSWSLVLSWNSQRLAAGTPPPSSWADFFDTAKYPGPRALRNTSEGNLEIALLADGVPKEQLYQNGLDVARALKKLSSIQNSITWWEAGAELEQKLTSSAVLAAAWNGRVAHLKQAANVPVGWTYNGSINQFDWWVVPVNAPHKDLAMKFLAATAEGTGQVEIARGFGYGPVAKAALAAMPQDLRAETPSAPENARLGVVFDGAWWASHTKEVTDQWNQWRIRQ